MTLLLLFIVYLAGSLIAKSVQNAAAEQRRQDAIKCQIEKQRAAERRAEYKRMAAEQKRLEDERKARQKQIEAEHKAEYTRLKAEQNADSIRTQIEQNQELYAMIEKAINGNITEKQRITYTRQLMTIDNKIYQLNNKLADLTYQLA